MDLSIIIVSFNTKKLLKECINSVIKTTKNIKYEIIVVDNASTDGSVEQIQSASWRTKIRLIKNQHNLGFGRANNQGVKKSRGKYVLLLNSDTKLASNVLGEMIAWMDKHPKVGIATCALKNSDGSLQATGGYFPSLLKVVTWMLFLDNLPFLDRLVKPFHPMHPKSFLGKGLRLFKKANPRDWVTGAFFLMRSKVAKDVGQFDDDYFMYVEEVDYCFRAKKMGWEVWYLPKWSIIHYGGKSGGHELAIVSEYKGLITYYKKHMPKWQSIPLKLLLKVGALLRIVVFGILEGREPIKTYAKAYKAI